MKLSVCIPYYNRSDLVLETLRPLIPDERIDEIILCDDCSPQTDFNQLLRNTGKMEKVRIVRNLENHHNQHNKRNALSFAKNEWVLLVDNDNVVGTDMLNKFFNFAIDSIDAPDGAALQSGTPDGAALQSKTIYHPAFASPNFDYRMFNGHIINKINVNNYTVHPIFVTLCNTNNYFINRNEYLRVYEYNQSVRGADGIFFTYLWLKAGNEIKIVDNMQYFHRVHPGSEFLRESESNMKLIYYWLEQLKKLPL
jgi:glycosyltransferase involved in cell wall biosynthesis